HRGHHGHHPAHFLLPRAGGVFGLGGVRVERRRQRLVFGAALAAGGRAGGGGGGSRARVPHHQPDHGAHLGASGVGGVVGVGPTPHADAGDVGDVRQLFDFAPTDAAGEPAAAAGGGTGDFFCRRHSD